MLWLEKSKGGYAELFNADALDTLSRASKAQKAKKTKKNHI